MSARFDETYRGFHLRCGPQPTHDGRFLAFVHVSHGSRPAKLDWAALLDLPSFSTEGEAVHASRMAALLWIDEHLTGSGAKKTYRERVREQADRANRAWPVVVNGALDAAVKLPDHGRVPG